MLDHINIYSKSDSLLGRELSNFTHSPIGTIDGQFASIEAYWYWLLAGDTFLGNRDREGLKLLSGYKAKEVGRKLTQKDWDDSPLFKLKIYSSMVAKLVEHPNILELFLQNKLPFRHYYVYGEKIVEPKESRWIVDMWNFLREQICLR